MDKKILLQNLADSVAERSGITKRKAEAFVRSFFEITEDGLLADGIVKVKGFGTTKIVAVGGRESVNINTGERFQIEGHDKVTFTPDTPFRDLVNRPFAHFTTTILADNLDEEELAAASLLSQEPEPTPEEDAPEVEEVAPAVEEVTPAVEEEKPAVAEEAPIEEAEVPVVEEEVPVEEEETPVEEQEAPVEEQEAPIEEQEAPVEETTPTATIETEVETEEHPESSQTTETSEDMQQPIIIQNTIPESRTNWWRAGFIVLTTLVLMTLSYFAGYYRVFCPCEWEDATEVFVDAPEIVTEGDSTVESNNESAQTTVNHQNAALDSQSQEVVATDEKAESLNLAEEKTAAERLAAQRAAEDKKIAAEKAAAEKANAEKKLKDAARKYPQMEGEYLITGVLKVHEMKSGDNLYKLARQAYGDKRLASYIVFHNNISNPDLVRTGQKIEIPQLTRK